MAKKSRSKGGARQAVAAEPAVTMQALEEMSDSDGALPPEAEWGRDAMALKAAIEGGAYDALLKLPAAEDGGGGGGDDDGDSFEEVDLDDDDESDDDDEPPAAKKARPQAEEVEDDDEEDGEDDDGDNDDDNVDENVAGSSIKSAELEAEDDEEGEGEEEELAEEDDEDEDDEREVGEALAKDSDEDDESDNDDDGGGKASPTMAQKNAVKAKALLVVTAGLVAEKKGWAWAETLDVMPSAPLPFAAAAAAATTEGAVAAAAALGVHDDLQREVAFYDLALAAVEEAKELCKRAGVPFARPEDFFAEMVKTDEHMAKVKDRLIFETKKMDAVAMRKSNKEQKLRSKETQSNKLAEKAKKKKDHFKAVEEWAESARANRGRGRLADSDAGEARFNNPPSHGGGGKSRAHADRKYGHGGPRGRFKQNDPAALSDMSGYNRRGNFGGLGTKKSAAGKPNAGANRKGKRARDASRSR